LFGGFLFLRIGVPAEMMLETRARLPRAASRLLGMLLTGKA
jgi:hypothetical protein